MTENLKETSTSKNNGVPIASSEQKQLITIQGTLTSPIQLCGERTPEPYHYSFIRLKGQSIDLPVIFKLTDKMGFSQKPYLEKGMELELFGHYSISDKSVRKSFTATNYRLLNLDEYLAKKRIRKKCVGCCDTFTCLQSENYDYCKDCSLNGSRYINKSSKCSECDGSGLIKFPNQPPRSCKLCCLTQPKEGENIFAK